MTFAAPPPVGGKARGQARCVGLPLNAEDQALLAELARVKVIFQMRAIAAHMGLPMPTEIGEQAA
ncbi:MAG: hypothetical protein ABW043_16970 [Devosia sp.]|uniref:hypothetical protein n=1 Tax=Devosia sp. TaxID=1871048 RepID=UPI003399694D